jgi:hypothetical protein
MTESRDDDNTPSALLEQRFRNRFAVGPDRPPTVASVLIAGHLLPLFVVAFVSPANTWARGVALFINVSTAARGFVMWRWHES